MITQNGLKQILKRTGKGIVSSVGGGIGAKVHREGEVSELERRVGLTSVRTPGLAKDYTGRCVVSIKVYRRRLTDTGNDCTKYHIDSLRYLGWLADDNDKAIRLIDEGHEKVESNEEERVEITVEYPGETIESLCREYANGPKPI